MRRLARWTLTVLIFLGKLGVALLLGVWPGGSPVAARPRKPSSALREAALLAAVSLFALLSAAGVLAVALDHTADASLWVTGPLMVGAFTWAAVYQGGRLRRLRAGRRRGRCRSCGYDLRATPSRCPECGTIRARNRCAASPAGRSTQ
jgi:hypothetical protein